MADRLGLRGRIMTATILLVVIIDIVSGIFLETDLREQLQQRIEAELRQAAVVGELVLERSDRPDSPGTADDVAAKPPFSALMKRVPEASASCVASGLRGRA